MKIIGKQGSQWIATIDLAEIANILGFSSTYSTGFEDELRKCGETHYDRKLDMEGVTIPVEKFAKYVAEIRNKEADGKKAAETLRNLANALSAAWPTLTVSSEQ